MDDRSGNGGAVADIEVFADVGCPFTHVGLLRFVEERSRHGREDLGLVVRAWPLEVVNGKPLDPAFIREEVDEIRSQLGGGLFSGFDEASFPHTSIPAMSLAASAYESGTSVGEAVSLRLRDLLFEQGFDISDDDLLAGLARSHGVDWDPSEHDAHEAQVAADHERGVDLGVVGSPHFLTGAGGFFCPALDVSRGDDGHLRVTADREGFDRFLAAALE
ncbi:MAG: DsbA family protein [Actinomycetia bacterium]|nr:DsbA family protein [Actinomycetes bacterium]